MRDWTYKQTMARWRMRVDSDPCLQLWPSQEAKPQPLPSSAQNSQGRSATASFQDPGSHFWCRTNRRKSNTYPSLTTWDAQLPGSCLQLFQTQSGYTWSPPLHWLFYHKALLVLHLLWVSAKHKGWWLSPLLKPPLNKQSLNFVLFGVVLISLYRRTPILCHMFHGGSTL